MKLDLENEFKPWHKLTKEIIFTISPDTTTLSLSELPADAKEIKVHIYSATGQQQYQTEVSYYFSTLYDAARVSCKIYPQNAFTTGNQIVTFLLDDRRIIDVKKDGNPQGLYMGFEIILYR